MKTNALHTAAAKGVLAEQVVAVPLGSKTRLYTVEGCDGEQFLFLRPSTYGTYSDAYLGWVVVSERDTDYYFGFVVGGRALRYEGTQSVAALDDVFREVAERVGAYFGAPHPVHEMGEAGELPAPGEIATQARLVAVAAGGE